MTRRSSTLPLALDAMRLPSISESVTSTLPEIDLALATRPPLMIRTVPLTDSADTSPLMSFAVIEPEMDVARTRRRQGR